LDRVKLELRNIAKRFKQQKQEVEVLSRIDLLVREGEFVSMIGPSGCGKSTIFHIIGGITKPSSGEVYMDGKEVTGQKGLISYMPQFNTLFPWRTVEENVILTLEVAGVPKKEALQNARLWLERVGLREYAHHYPHLLSGGMQQRVAFIRALLSPQELICLDEPFGALDALTREEMQQWLLNLWEHDRRSVLFITHSIEEALFLSDRIYLLSHLPTRVMKEITVPYQRPRDRSILTDPHFVEMRQEIYDQMAKYRANRNSLEGVLLG